MSEIRLFAATAQSSKYGHLVKNAEAYKNIPAILIINQLVLVVYHVD